MLGNLVAVTVAEFLAILALVWLWLNGSTATARPKHAARGRAEDTGEIPRHAAAEVVAEPWGGTDPVARHESTTAIGRSTVLAVLAARGGGAP